MQSPNCNPSLNIRTKANEENYRALSVPHKDVQEDNKNGRGANMAKGFIKGGMVTKTFMDFRANKKSPQEKLCLLHYT